MLLLWIIEICDNDSDEYYCHCDSECFSCDSWQWCIMKYIGSLSRCCFGREMYVLKLEFLT